MSVPLQYWLKYVNNWTSVHFHENIKALLAGNADDHTFQPPEFKSRRTDTSNGFFSFLLDSLLLKVARPIYPTACIKVVAKRQTKKHQEEISTLWYSRKTKYTLIITSINLVLRNLLWSIHRKYTPSIGLCLAAADVVHTLYTSRHTVGGGMSVFVRVKFHNDR